MAPRALMDQAWPLPLSCDFHRILLPSSPEGTRTAISMRLSLKEVLDLAASLEKRTTGVINDQELQRRIDLLDEVRDLAGVLLSLPAIRTEHPRRRLRGSYLPEGSSYPSSPMSGNRPSTFLVVSGCC